MYNNICPRSLDQFYIVKLTTQNWTRLPGHKVLVNTGFRVSDLDPGALVGSGFLNEFESGYGLNIKV